MGWKLVSYVDHHRNMLVEPTVTSNELNAAYAADG